MKNPNTKEVNNAVDLFFKKLHKIDIDALKISDYNKRYLRDYKNNSQFFTPLYQQLLYKALNKLSKHTKNSVFIDYGGGCGVLSFIAKYLGFKTVIYNDIYDVSVNDVKEMTFSFDCSIDFFISGDVKELLTVIENKEIVPDLICSFDVLEHIYNLESWFNNIKKIQTPFSLCFMTSANGSNPYIKKKLKKIHYKAEHIGTKKIFGWKERDAYLPFLTIRENIIKEEFSEFSEIEIKSLAKQTRGLIKEDIIKFINTYLIDKSIENTNSFLTNTCDPYTGNWAEHIIDLNKMKQLLEDKNTIINFTNSYYSYSKNRFLNLPKFILNSFMKLLGRDNICFSPSYTLELDYKKELN